MGYMLSHTTVFSVSLNITKICISVCLPALKMLSAVYPLLHQYSKLYEKLLNDLVVAHQTLCKLLSTLLHLFSTLATKVNITELKLAYNG